MYEFNPGASPDDQSRLYIFSGGFAQLEYFCGAPEDTTLDSLGLKEGQQLGYTFDVGDNWEHELAPVKGKYAKIIAKVGA